MSKVKSKSAREWLHALSSAEKREKPYRASAENVVKIYEVEKAHATSTETQGSSVPFNILYSNTETLSPALYNSLPQPKVQQRFFDQGKETVIAAETAERLLQFLLDNDLVGYQSFDEVMQSAVTDALVAGRGILRVKYEAEPPAEDAGQEILPEGEEEEAMEGESEALSSSRLGESAVCEFVPWDRILHGWARNWGDVPWIAFLHYMTKDEIISNFGEEASTGMTFANDPECPEGTDGSAESLPVTVYEVWDKRTKKVMFISAGKPDAFLKVVDDPLSLTGFFPIPRPLMLFRRISSLLPTPPYIFYEDQARELNQVTVRIRRIVAALKVRGFYDSTIEGIEKLLVADDNTFFPAQNVAALQQGTSLERSLFIMPIEKLTAVLQQLYIQREQIKQVIYEITGIADIMRGSTQASETLGAQQIKSQWGTLRLKKAQKEVARFARDALRMMAEVAVTKFDSQTILAMTGMQLPTQAQKEQMLMQMQLQQMQQMQAQAQGMAPGMAPAPAPQAPPPDLPPSIEEIQSLLQSDLMRAFSVDIETNSTVELEATQDKQEVAELMNAMAQFMNGIAPAAERGILPFEAAKAMLLGIIKKFRFGMEVENIIEKMQPPPPKEEPKDAKNSPEVIQAQVQAEQQKAATGLQVARQELELKEKEHQMKLMELQMKQEMLIQKHQMEMQKMQMQAALGNSGGLINNNSAGKPDAGRPSSSFSSRGDK